jgi:hypothetical protein
MLFKDLHNNSNGNSKKTLYKSFDTPFNVKIYESFSGGLFRGKAGNTINKLTIYNLLRGLEIETDAESYSKLAKEIPSCSTVFVEADAETTNSSQVLIKQIEYIKNEIQKVETKYKTIFEFVNNTITGQETETLDDKFYKDIEPIIKKAKESGLRFGKIKAIIKAVHQDNTLNSFIDSLIKAIESDDSGLEAEIFNKIDDMDLKEIEAKDFAPMPKNYISEVAEPDTLVSSNNPMLRISGFLEKVLGVMKIDGISYVSGNDPFKFLSSIIVSMSKVTGVTITPSDLKNYQELINEIGTKIIEPEIESFISNHAKSITIPSLQSLYFSLISSMILKLINYNVKKTEDQAEATKKEEEAKGKGENKILKLSEETSKSYNMLLDSDFFDGARIFYSKPRKEYTDKEYEMIKSLKEVFVSVGLISEKSKEYIEKKNFGTLLTDAIKEFQELVGLNNDGKIGKDTKLALRAFMESLKENSKPTEKKP